MNLALHARNVVRAMRPPMPASGPPLRLAHDDAVLLFHGLDVPSLGMHRAAELRARLAPVAGRCTITFDDGYAHTLAGIRDLAADGHRIVLFLCAWLLDDPWLPKDRLQVLAARVRTGDVLRVGPFVVPVLSGNPRYRQWLGFRVNRLLMEALDRDRYVRAVLEATRDVPPVDDPAAEPLRLASAEALCDLLADCPDIAVGLHGHAHYRFDRLGSAADRDAEVVAAQARLETLVGRTIDAVAPPYGLTDASTNAWLGARFRTIHLLDDPADAHGATGVCLRVPADRRPIETGHRGNP